jgi:hypothetical protein
MRKKVRFSNLLLTAFFVQVLLLNSCSSCKSRNERSSASQPIKASVHISPKSLNKIRKVIFYLENSESMFGYVNGFTEYVDVVSELSEKPEFAEEKTFRDFYMINGKNLCITRIGDNPVILKGRLNRVGFNCGNITKSNLNGMFQTALNSTGGDSISVLISDGIYDIGQPGAPFNALATEGKETRSRFIERLTNDNLQTIMIKLNSHFDGDYFYASQQGKIKINQSRPYYIWIFGKSELLNKYFKEEYLASKLKGYESMVRFLKIEKRNVSYQVISQDIIGSFNFDKKQINRLKNSKVDRNGRGFQFTIAVDFSSLPISESYLVSPENYYCTGNFKVIGIKKSDKKVYETNFKPTHLITLFTDKSPNGKLILDLKNKIPSWIENTSTNNELNIQKDTTHTFGFKYLTEGISGAYEYFSGKNSIASFEIEIIK